MSKYTRTPVRTQMGEKMKKHIHAFRKHATTWKRFFAQWIF